MTGFYDGTSVWLLCSFDSKLRSFSIGTRPILVHSFGTLLFLCANPIPNWADDGSGTQETMDSDSSDSTLASCAAYAVARRGKLVKTSPPPRFRRLQTYEVQNARCSCSDLCDGSFCDGAMQVATRACALTVMLRSRWMAAPAPSKTPVQNHFSVRSLLRLRLGLRYSVGFCLASHPIKQVSASWRAVSQTFAVTCGLKY